MEQLASDITNHIFTPVSYLHGQFCRESELYVDGLYSAQKSMLTGRVENVYNFLWDKVFKHRAMENYFTSSCSKFFADKDGID
jgi:hypothetical protein